jgi:hypothetical protein
MVKKLSIYTLIAVPAAVIYSCITPFTPDGLKTTGGTLVIEGDIILNDVTKVILSHTIPLSDDNAVDYVLDADVWVENEHGVRYNGTLNSPADGVPHYIINTNAIDAGLKYKLCVILHNKKYESELQPAIAAPAIDSIGYIVNSNRTSVEFYVNTQGADDASRYYKWRFTEDWEFHSIHFALIYYDPADSTLKEFNRPENNYYCWNKAESSAILIAKTDHLDRNVVYQKILTKIDENSLKINYLYSMELTQMCISEEAYHYWSTMEKNSDRTGGIFAPQPSEIRGNIKCVSDPSEKVIGYISVATVATRRTFAHSRDMRVYKFPVCKTMTYYEGSTSYKYDSLYSYGNIPIVYDKLSGGVDWAPVRCVDCQVYGTKNKPSYWPNDDI